jgi:hypothetical protein
MKFKYQIVSFLAIGSFFLFAESCKPKKELAKTEASTKCKTVYTYTEHIAPIMQQHCAGSCHSAVKKAYGIDLSTYEMVSEEAAKKRFMGSLRHEGVYPKMPKKAEKLDDATLDMIACWIETGMKK